MSAVLKRYGGALIFITVLSLTSVLIIGFAKREPSGLYFASRDSAWIGDVENFIKKENWEPDSEYEPLMGTAFFLCENGEEQFFSLYSQSEFKSYINGIMNRVDSQVIESISEEFLNQILDTDKVLLLVYRFSSKSGMWNEFPNTFGTKINYDRAYFVLEDKLGTGLEGTIIIREQHMEKPYEGYSVWEVTN